MKTKRGKMRRTSLYLISGILVMVLSALVSLIAFAQAKYPSRPITFVCTYGAGGGSDSWLRTTATFLQKQLRVNIIVSNQPGAGGLVQLQHVIKNVETDGYTLYHIEDATFKK